MRNSSSSGPGVGGPSKPSPEPPEGTLVFFALGEAVRGSALNTAEDYESGELLEISFWRWAATPLRVLAIRPDPSNGGKHVEEWDEGAFGEDGLHSNARQLHKVLESHKDEDGEFFDLWTAVDVGADANAVDGWKLGAAAAARVGIELASENWYEELYPEEAAEAAAHEAEAKKREAARKAALEARVHTCTDLNSLACNLAGTRTVFTATSHGLGTCVSCEKSFMDGLERVDNGIKSGVTICEYCWAKMMKAASFHQRYSSTSYFYSFNILPEGAEPVNCCASPPAAM